MNASSAQIVLYQPWLIIAGVAMLFVLLRVTRQALRRRVDMLGYFLLKERGVLIWFWMNAPGVMLHELSHASVILLFRPFGFRITSIALFRVKPILQTAGTYGHRNSIRGIGRQSVQLGEVQYTRPQGHFMSYIGDGLSGVAPLFGGTAMFILLYWIATGYGLWDLPWDIHQHLQFLRPGWPWWTLTFTPYLILTVTSELWPSRVDWKGARWFVIGFTILALLAFLFLWYLNPGFDHHLFSVVVVIATHLDFALLVLLALNLLFLLAAEGILRLVS